MRTVATLVALTALELEGESLPSEFRIFAAGQNDSNKGPAIFDAAAARSVMATYKRQGVRAMVDLEHLSLDRKAPNYDPDARAWFDLEVRNGELWATNVRWTAEGAARLRERKQVYLSPAFYQDKSGRVLELVNVALCAMPATYGAEALIAASRDLETRSMMNAEDVQKALDAIEAGDLEAAKELLKKIVATAASGGEAPAAAPLEEPAAMSEPAPVEEEEADPAALASAAVRLMRLTGKGTFAGVVEVVEGWQKDASEIAKQRAKLEADRAAFEAEERDRLVVALVRAGEPPATAWEDPALATDVAKRKPAVPWSTMPIAALRTRVERMGGKVVERDASPPPATRTDDAASQLTADQLRICAEMKCKPEVFLALRNAQAAAIPTTNVERSE